jgi:nifR3 family TIM-barrel protein
MLKLGQLSLDVPFFQAALSGYSDYAMRKLAKAYGAPLTFTGVILAKSAANPKVIGRALFKPYDDEHPVGAQILGDQPKVMADAATALVGSGYDLIDLNFACPAPKVLRHQRGGFLLKEPQTIIEIYRQVRDTVTCPVLVKLRTGFDDTSESSDNFWKIVSQLCADGVDALIIHGRNVKQRFTGSADWNILAEVKRRFPQTIIIGSGDLFDAPRAAQTMKASSVDGIAIARGAVGNPWIFRNLRSIFEGRTVPGPSNLNEQKQTILQHFEMIEKLYPPKKAIKCFRKFIIGYCNFHPARKKAQKALLAADDRNQLLAEIDVWYG